MQTAMATFHTMYKLAFVIPKTPFCDEKKVVITGTKNGLRISVIEWAGFICDTHGGIAAWLVA